MSISITQAARLLNTNQQEVYQQLKNGQLTSRTIDGRRVISEGCLQEYLARKRHLKVFKRKYKGLRK